jgi:hypothetical protein
MSSFSQFTVTEDDILISFNMEPVFTKVPMHDALEIIREHITAADLPQDLSSLIQHCVNSTFFIHHGKFYRQV